MKDNRSIGLLRVLFILFCSDKFRCQQPKGKKKYCLGNTEFYCLHSCILPRCVEGLTKERDWWFPRRICYSFSWSSVDKLAVVPHFSHQNSILFAVYLFLKVKLKLKYFHKASFLMLAGLDIIYRLFLRTKLAPLN